jgi:hypothetical protein
MGHGFHVEPEQLASHSETVGRIGESVNEIASAAATEGFGGLVYGVLFDALAQPFLNLWADHLRDLITQNAELGRAIAGGIASNADTYDGIEQHTKDHVSRSGSGK